MIVVNVSPSLSSYSSTKIRLCVFRPSLSSWRIIATQRPRKACRNREFVQHTESRNCVVISLLSHRLPSIITQQVKYRKATIPYVSVEGHIHTSMISLLSPLPLHPNQSRSVFEDFIWDTSFFVLHMIQNSTGSHVEEGRMKRSK